MIRDSLTSRCNLEVLLELDNFRRTLTQNKREKKKDVKLKPENSSCEILWENEGLSELFNFQFQLFI